MPCSRAEVRFSPGFGPGMIPAFTRAGLQWLSLNRVRLIAFPPGRVTSSVKVTGWPPGSFQGSVTATGGYWRM
jgi:hypothetical protein